MVFPTNSVLWPVIRPILFGLSAAAWFSVTGCAQRHEPPPPPPPLVLVVAPVLNLSGSDEFDSLKVTDLLASEVVGFEGVQAIPVNLTLAALARRGKASVDSPEEALELAREFSADATLVLAVTEYRPYEPPVIGLVMQWYYEPRRAGTAGLDPVASSRSAQGPPVTLAAEARGPQFLQRQRVFNAADDTVKKELKRYAKHRDADDSPYGWQKYVKSQELYVRYASYSMIRTMLGLWGRIPEFDPRSEAEP